MGTPCERMQSANLTRSCCPCCIWAWVGGPAELGELEARAAITVAAAIEARTAVRWDVDLDMS